MPDLITQARNLTPDAEPKGRKAPAEYLRAAGEAAASARPDQAERYLARRLAGEGPPRDQ